MLRLLLACLLAALAGCSTVPPIPTSTPAPLLPTMTAQPSPTATATIAPTPTPLGCLTASGQVRDVSIDDSKPPQLFKIYLPPCYDSLTGLRYPVLYLLHGQLSIDDQWVRMGAPSAADDLIHSGQAAPFIMIFPDDRYWNLPPGPFFGDRLIHLIIPYVDSHYRTLAKPSQRALGGLSRGGAWAIHMALTEYNTFGIVGLHSPVIFDADNAVLDKSMAAIPDGSWPRLWIDGGDHDGQLGDIRRFEGMLASYEIPHIWHLYPGDHSESYWEAHLTEYLLWYTQQFAASP